MTGFIGIGLSSKIGDISNIIETYSSIVKIVMTAKDSLDVEIYKEEAEVLRIELLNAKNSRVFNTWLSNEKQNIAVEDYRSKIF